MVDPSACLPVVVVEKRLSACSFHCLSCDRRQHPGTFRVVFGRGFAKRRDQFQRTLMGVGSLEIRTDWEFVGADSLRIGFDRCGTVVSGTQIIHPVERMRRDLSAMVL